MLCESLNEKVKSGKSKVYQLEEFNRYFSYTKKGNSFIINEVYSSPLPKPLSEIDYIEDIEKLILDLLVQDYSRGQVFLSKNMLLKELKMININYAHCKYRTAKLSALLNISKEEIDDFYTSSDSTLVRNLETALNNLRKKSLIFWNHALTICFLNTNVETNEYDKIKGVKYRTTNEYGEEETIYDVIAPVKHIIHRKAKKEELEIVLHIERETLKKYKCDSISDLFKINKVDTFYKEVKELLFEKANIINYYNSYEIFCNEDHIYEKWEELEDLKLERKESKTTQEKLNKGVMKRLNTNAERRHSRAANNENINYSDARKVKRINKDYIGNSYKLTDTLINKDAMDIREEVSKTKHK